MQPITALVVGFVSAAEVVLIYKEVRAGHGRVLLGGFAFLSLWAFLIWAYVSWAACAHLQKVFC